jgi:hypothetical protein
MAKLMLIGKIGRKVELTFDPEEGTPIAKCVHHDAPGSRNGCEWTERYDTLNDATEYAADHADGRR